MSESTPSSHTYHAEPRAIGTKVATSDPSAAATHLREARLKVAADLNANNNTMMADYDRRPPRSPVPEPSGEKPQVEPPQQKEVSREQYDHHEEALEPSEPRRSLDEGRKSFAQRAWAHVVRHRGWYIALLCIIVFLIIFLPILFLVAIPAIVRSTVASASLPVRAALLEAVAPATVRMGLATELTTPARLAVRLDAFRLDLYNPATPGRPTFVTLAVPAHALRGASPLSVPPQDAAVRHPGELSRFLAATFAAGTAAGRAASGTTRPLPDRRATVGVRGATVARLGAGNTLAYPIRLDKEVRLDGLDRLDGLRVQELTPVSAAEALADPGLGNDTNLRGTLWLPNVSQLTLHLGNVSHRAEVAGVAVGTATIDDLRINPGNQTVAYEGQLDAAAVMANLSAVMGAVDAAGDMELVVKANRAVVDGQHIEYLDEVLSQIGVNTKLSVCDAIKSIPKEVMQNIPPAMMTKLPLKQIMACM